MTQTDVGTDGTLHACRDDDVVVVVVMLLKKFWAFAACCCCCIEKAIVDGVNKDITNRMRMDMVKCCCCCCCCWLAIFVLVSCSVICEKGKEGTDGNRDITLTRK